MCTYNKEYYVYIKHIVCMQGIMYTYSKDVQWMKDQQTVCTRCIWKLRYTYARYKSSTQDAKVDMARLEPVCAIHASSAPSRSDTPTYGLAVRRIAPFNNAMAGHQLRGCGMRPAGRGGSVRKENSAQEIENYIYIFTSEQYISKVTTNLYISKVNNT